MSTIGGTTPQTVSLQQFVTENPGAKGLADVLKSKGMSDTEIVAMLQKGKSEWVGSASTPTLPGPGSGAKAGDVDKVLSNTSSTELHADIFTFMALFAKLAQEMRQAARNDRESQLQVQVSTLQAAADQMKAAAEARFNAAIISGACQIGAGALQVGAAGMSAKTLAGAKGADAATAQRLTTQAGNWTTSGQGIGQIVQGGGTIAAGSQELAAGEADSKGKKLDAQAKIVEEARNKANDVMQQMMDIIRDIRDKLGAIEQSNVEANRGIAHNI